MPCAACLHLHEDSRSCVARRLGQALSTREPACHPCRTVLLVGRIAAILPRFSSAWNPGERRPEEPDESASNSPPCGRRLPLDQSTLSESAARSLANVPASAHHCCARRSECDESGGRNLRASRPFSDACRPDRSLRQNGGSIRNP